MKTDMSPTLKKVVIIRTWLRSMRSSKKRLQRALLKDNKLTDSLYKDTKYIRNAERSGQISLEASVSMCTEISQRLSSVRAHAKVVAEKLQKIRDYVDLINSPDAELKAYFDNVK